MLAQTILPPASAPVGLTPSAKDDDRISLKSQSSSVSQSSHSSHGSLRKFHHHFEPTVLDRPDAVDAIRDALLTDNASLLAEIAGEYGLPPSLRASAWPLLLRTHPYVLNPPVKNPEPLPADEIPVKRIRGDLKRFRRYRGPSLLEKPIFDAIYEFLARWGSVIRYDGAMIWIADFLASGDLSSAEDSEMASSASTEGSSMDLFMAESPIGSQDDFGEASQAFTGVSSENLPEVFTNVMLVMSHSPAEFSDFVSAVRVQLPMVARHFECEDVLSGTSGGDDWLIWWLRWLGIRAFAPSTVARLWDTYFAIRDSSTLVPRLHLYNCILLMKENCGRITELDQSECREFLAHLPSCKDVEAIIVEARALASDCHCEGTVTPTGAVS